MPETNLNSHNSRDNEEVAADAGLDTNNLDN
jgi:hypothetical protein